MDQGFDLRVYIRLAKRRFFHALIPAALVFALVCIVAYKLPPVFESTATIVVESQQIPRALARSTVTSAAEERIRIIEQRLMTRENILDIVRKLDLFVDLNASPTEKVNLVRESTTIGQIATGGRRRGGRTIAFTVSFEHTNANTAARVANEFASRILEQNIQSRTDRASQTHEFFTRLVSQLEAEMAQQSAKIVEFKDVNKASLPETLELRRNELAELQKQRDEIDVKIDQFNNLLGQSLEPTGIASVDYSAAQLDKLRNQLVELRAFYTDTHPAVKRVRVQIRALENAAVENSAAEQPKPRPKPEQGDKRDEENENEQVAQTDTTVSRSRRVSQIETEIQSLNERGKVLDERIALLVESIDKTAQTEMELDVMLREFQNMKIEYRGVINKRVDAETGERLEEDRQAERFEIVDQATASTDPIKPDRQKIILAGFFGGGAVGVGLALLLEILSTGIRTGTELANKTGVHPIVSIPYIRTKSETRNKFKKLMLIAGVLVVSFAVVLAWIHFSYKPLDILGYRILNRFGL